MATESQLTHKTNADLGRILCSLWMQDLSRLLGRHWEHFGQIWFRHFHTGRCSNDVVATDCHHHKTNGEHHYHQTARCAYAALGWLRPLAYAHPTNYLHLAIATNSRHRSLVFPFFHFLLLSSFGQNQLSHLSSFGRFSILLRQSSASNTFHPSCQNLAKIFGKMKKMKKLHESL